MAMDAGNAVVGGGGSGLAQEMADLMLSALGGLGTPPGSTVAEQQVDDVCNAIAKAVVSHITANAEVLTSVATTVASGIPVATAGSPSAQTGATTATGAGAGTGTGSSGSAVF